MKIDFSQRLKNLDGSDLDWAITACGLCGREREVKPAILGILCADALVQGYTDARGQTIQLTGDEVVRRYGLATKIVNAGTLEMELEDVTLIRELVVKRFTTLFSGQIWPMLDPKE